jgi:hypothetical protein
MHKDIPTGRRIARKILVALKLSTPSFIDSSGVASGFPLSYDIRAIKVFKP